MSGVIPDCSASRSNCRRAAAPARIAIQASRGKRFRLHEFVGCRVLGDRVLLGEDQHERVVEEVVCREIPRGRCRIVECRGDGDVEPVRGHEVSSVDGLDVDEIEVRASVTVPLPHRLTVLRHGGGLLLVALCLRTLLQRVGDHASPLPADPLHRPPSDRFWTTTALGLVWATVPMPGTPCSSGFSNADDSCSPPPGPGHASRLAQSRTHLGGRLSGRWSVTRGRHLGSP